MAVSQPYLKPGMKASYAGVVESQVTQQNTVRLQHQGTSERDHGEACHSQTQAHERPSLAISAFDHDLDLHLNSVDIVYKGYGQEIDIPVEGYSDLELSFESSEDHKDREKLEGDSFPEATGTASVEASFSSMAESLIDDGDNAGSFTPNVKGRLKERLGFWKEIGAGNWVIKILSQGYAIPFTSEPEPAIFRNNRSALDNADFVTEEILDLLDSGRERGVDFSEVHTINPLSVADKGEKLRLILDLRYINKFLQVLKFKCEDILLIKDLFNTGDFSFKSDIRSGYHHIDIHPRYQKYLAFSWIIEGAFEILSLRSLSFFAFSLSNMFSQES